MPSQHYRLYCLNSLGGIDLADWIKADSDEEAVRTAVQVKHGARKIEVWRSNRLVAALVNPDDDALQTACAERLFAYAEQRKRRVAKASP